MASIRKRQDKWQVQIRRRGGPNLTRSFHLKADATAWARAQEVEIDKLTLPLDPRVLERTTIRDLVERYIDEITPTKKGADAERWVLKAFLKHPLARAQLARLNTADFARYRNERLRQVSSGTVQRQLAPLQHMFSIAISEWGYPLFTNPLLNLRKPQASTPRERRLRPGEEERLLDVAADLKNDYLGHAISLALETAMRRGEILNIKKDHLFADPARLRIPKTKTGHPRTIPLSNRALDVLEQRERLNINGQMFGITPNAFRLSWQRLIKRAQLKDLRFHDLRHEAISRLFESGLNMSQVRTISGHKDFRMLARYTHLDATSFL